MAKKQKKKSKKKQPVYAGEDNGSVAITVVWMMAFLTAAIALPLTLLASFLFTSTAEHPVTAHTQVLPALMFLITLIGGSFAMLLTPVVYKVREIPPPPLITAAVFFVGAIPWLLLAIGL